MAKIIGNPTVTPMAIPDWLQDDPLKADFIKNKPIVNLGTITDLSILNSCIKEGVYVYTYDTSPPISADRDTDCNKEIMISGFYRHERKYGEEFGGSGEFEFEFEDVIQIRLTVNGVYQRGGAHLLGSDWEWDEWKNVSPVKKNEIDQTYSPTSENAQSGKAVAEAIADIQVSGGAVQSDWEETNTESMAYIQNKPSIPTKFSDLEVDTIENIPISISSIISKEMIISDNNDNNYKLYIEDGNLKMEQIESIPDESITLNGDNYATKAELDSKADTYEVVAGEEVYERLSIVEGEKDIIQWVKGYASASSGMVGGTNTSYSTYYFAATKDFKCYFEEAEKVNGGYLSIALFDNGFNIEGATKPSVFLRLSNGDVMPNVENKLSVTKGQTVALSVLPYNQNASVKFYQNMILTEEPQTVKMLSEDVHIGVTHSEDLKPFLNLFTPLVKKEGEILKVYLPLKRKNGYYAYFSFRKFVSESTNMDQWKLDEFCITDTKLVNLWAPEVNIEWEGVFKEFGYSDDFIGGYHGDETNEMLSIFIDGLDCDMSGDDFELKNFSEVKIVAKSILNRCNTPDTPIATRYKELIFTENGLEIKNRWIFNENCQKLYPFYPAMMAIYHTGNNANGVSYCRNNDNYVVQPVGDAVEGSPLSPSTKANIAEMWNDKFLARMTVKENNLDEFTTHEPPTQLFIQNYPAQNRWKAYFNSNEGYINVTDGSEVKSDTLYEFI